MKYAFFLGILLLPTVSQAGLDEVVLRSADETCAIRYLTDQSMKGWYIETNQNCPDGWVNGYSKINIYNPQKELKEILTGFFLAGYWLDRFPAKGELQDRTNPSENVQALTFIADTDTEDNTTYLVQLRAERPQNRIYGPFQGCPIFRLLVVVKDKNLFQNEAFQEHLATKASAYAQRFCTNLETIAVFGATKKNARVPDILFQMQIDPETNEKTLVDPSNDLQESDLNEPIELRRQSGEILMSVEPNESDLLIQYGNKERPKIKDPVPVNTPKEDLTSLVHLNIQSQLTNHPTQGRVIVHINSIGLDGSASVDLPQPVLLKYHPHLKIGWAVVQGYFYQNKMQVNEITFCQKEWCSDVP